MRLSPKTLVFAVLALGVATAGAQSARSWLDQSVRPLAGKQPVNLASAYGGKVLLIANTASKCGYTPQYEALEAMHAKYAKKGFVVLGFPSGDFKSQEFEDEAQIREFCTNTYAVKFPMFEKVHVIGDQAHPVFKELARQSGQVPKWNFHKYLVGRDGRVVASFESKVKPDAPEVIAVIEAELKKPVPRSTGKRAR